MQSSGDLTALIEQLIVGNQQQQLRHEAQLRQQQLQLEQQKAQHDQALQLQLMNTEAMRAEFRELLKMKEDQAYAEKARRANPARFLIKLTAEDDIEAYLLTFERTAQREEWPEEQWVSLLAPFLSGAAQTAYQDKTVNAAVSYYELKTEILSRYGYSLVTRAQRFHDWGYDSASSPRAQMHELIRLATGWLLSDPKTLTPLERVVMDHYMRALPYDAKKLVCQNNPQSADQLVEILEGYQAAPLFPQCCA